MRAMTKPFDLYLDMLDSHFDASKRSLHSGVGTSE